MAWYLFLYIASHAEVVCKKPSSLWWHAEGHRKDKMPRYPADGLDCRTTNTMFMKSFDYNIRKLRFS